MANTRSAKKSIRSSSSKKDQNLIWRKKVKEAMKNIVRDMDENKDNPALLTKELSILQKVLDKASKEKAIHKNKANRLKSRYALKVSGLSRKTSTKTRKLAK